MAWVPTTDFEKEIVDSQPDLDFIFGRLSETTQQPFYPRPKEHLDFIEKQKKVKSNGEKKLPSTQNHTLNIISRVQRIAGTKPLGEQPTIDDWNDNENLERETIAMMRYVGLGPSIEHPLDEACTIATHPIKEEIKINRNGRKQMPIFFDDKFFELKPRIASSTSSSGNNSPILETEHALVINDDSSSTSMKSSIIAKSNDLLHEQSTYSGNSGFESAVDFAREEESFETACSSSNSRSRSIGHREDNNKKKIQNWRTVSNDPIRTQSWRNSSKSHKRSEVFKLTDNSDCNWRSNASNTAIHKEDNSSKNIPQMCTPKELYQRKRQK